MGGSLPHLIKIMLYLPLISTDHWLWRYSEKEAKKPLLKLACFCIFFSMLLHNECISLLNQAEQPNNTIRNSKPRATTAPHASCRYLSARIRSGILSKHHPLDVHLVRNISAKASNQERLLTFTFTSKCNGT